MLTSGRRRRWPLGVGIRREIIDNKRQQVRLYQIKMIQPAFSPFQQNN
jgi:hypothetical protein